MFVLKLSGIQIYIVYQKSLYKNFTPVSMFFLLQNKLCEFTMQEHNIKRCTQKPVSNVRFKKLNYTKNKFESKYILNMLT